jgi:selenophosphate synthase
MPIVDDPYDFGRIAATNAISDIYAMGGSPLMAIAIFGWPIDKLGPDIAGQVIDGGRHACQLAEYRWQGAIPSMPRNPSLVWRLPGWWKTNT